MNLVIKNILIKGRTDFLKALLVLSFLFTATAQAAVVMDADVEKFMSRPIESGRMRVIVTFKNSFQVQSQWTWKSRYYVQRALIENVRRSQDAILKEMAQDMDGQINVKRYWLVNAIAADLTKAQIKKLSIKAQVYGLFSASRTVSLDRPFPAYTPKQDHTYTYGLEKLKIPELRTQYPDLLGTGVRVGILDTGIEADHPDLIGKVVAWKDLFNKSETPVDGHSHGTHVAGTIAGGHASGDAIGVAPGSKLVVGRIFNASGSTTYEILLDGMQWIADPDGNPQTPDAPLMVSNSWGGSERLKNFDPKDHVFCQAIENWVRLAILPVFAAGNSGPGSDTVSVPGACPAALTVGATDSNDKIASFSSRGPAKWKTGDVLKPNLSAPGVKVKSSILNGKYGEKSGTSMATPHVTGVVALMYQAKPVLTMGEVYKYIIDTTDDLGPEGHDNDYGSGRVNALTVIQSILKDNQTQTKR